MADLRLFTSESVTEGHPDKICDQISDSILDALLTVDPHSRAAVETLVTTGLVHVAGEVTSNGYVFTNFDPTLVTGAAGSNANGISNAGQVVGTQVDANNASVFTNFAGTPTNLTTLNTGNNQVAFGINSAGNVVGGNGTTAFYLPNGGSPQTIAVPGNAINAFGINDRGNIVGQFTNGNATPGFDLPSATSGSFVTINAPNAATGTLYLSLQGVDHGGCTPPVLEGDESDGTDHNCVITLMGIINNCEYSLYNLDS